MPHQRRVLATAALLATQAFVEEIDEQSRQNSLYLLLGIQSSGTFTRDSGGPIPDVFTIMPPPTGATFPQFGYSCKVPTGTQTYECLIPQPQMVTHLI